MTYVAWKISGFSPYRVIGTGTILESAKFRYLLAGRLGVWAKNIHAYIIGEQGPSSSKFEFLQISYSNQFTKLKKYHPLHDFELTC